jgi:hypothetical protein
MEKPHPNLLLHCGADAVDREAVIWVPTPEATETFQPIPHNALICSVENNLRASGLTIGTQAHALTKDGQRYFGLMEVVSDQEDYSWVMGIRNSHDKTFPASVVAGSQVFVCDNLSFNGEVKLSRRHTRYILRDITLLVQRAIGKLFNAWHHQDARIKAYKQTAIDDPTAHHLVVSAMDVGVCGNRLIPDVLEEWRRPRHKQFEERHVWSLFNAFTECLKGNLDKLPARTEALHALLDGYVGISFDGLTEIG